MSVRKSLNHVPSLPLKVNLEEVAPMKRGIVAILNPDSERSKAGSIRRTLSADMSSKKWLEQNEFLSPIKKTSSSEALLLPVHDSSSSESEEEYEEIRSQADVWRSIQAQKERHQLQKPAGKEVWGSILTQKSENSLLPPPYAHPLVKRSASTLSEKSLEVCTESLGSETGSDCFSPSYSCSQTSINRDEDGEDRQRDRVEGEELKRSNPFSDFHVAKYKKSPAMPLPPPLPSIAGGHGASLHMHCRRENGRLVLEAVSVPPRNCFQAQRQDGRLLLTFATSSAENEVEELEEGFDDMEEVDEAAHEEEAAEDDCGDDDNMEEEEEAEEKSVGKESEFVMGLSLPNGMIRVKKTGLVMEKLMAVGNNPTWSQKKAVAEEEEELPVPESQSQPPPPRMARLIPSPPAGAAASLNVYDYFWRNKTTVSGGLINTMITNKNPINVNGAKECENQGLQLKRGNKTEQFAPFLKGCKEGRRLQSIWEPYCIAT